MFVEERYVLVALEPVPTIPATENVEQDSAEHGEENH